MFTSNGKSRTGRGSRMVAIHLRHILGIAILLLAIPAAAQWDTQSPLPTYLDVRGVGAPTAQRVFIATDDNSFDDGGALFESADGGATWVQRDVPFSLGSPLNGIFFLDDQNGWTWGNANYRTTDGGTTWTELPFLGSTYFMRVLLDELRSGHGQLRPIRQPRRRTRTGSLPRTTSSPSTSPTI